MTCGRCGFDNPAGFGFCGRCGAPLAAAQDRLTQQELDRLRFYLPSNLHEALRFEPASPPQSSIWEAATHLADLTTTVVKHLPLPLVEALVADPTPGLAGGQFVRGTLLFSDISGFTAMSEKLSVIGREGAEEVTQIANRYFTRMLEVIRTQGGHLIKFGGDALLVLFPEPYSAARAVDAALHMQAAMAEFANTETSQGTFPLRMKIGVHHGQFFATRLGTTQGMEYVLLGNDVNATAQAEGAATTGQVLVSARTLAAINVPCTTRPVGDDAAYFVVEQIDPLPPAPAQQSLTVPEDTIPTLTTLRRSVERLDAFSLYLPTGLLARLATNREAVSLEGEYRLVAVLFADIHGLATIVDELGPGQEAAVVAAINHYFAAMQLAFQRYGGVLNKMDLAEHGDKLLLIFGAPVAHEDDAERAVRAALAMQAALNELAAEVATKAGLPDLQLTQQIGISYSYVFAGYVGANWRHEYTVMGDEVNLAARLMSVSPHGAVTVGHKIRRKVQALFELAPQGEVRVKGKSAPIPIFTVTGPRAQPEAMRGLKGMHSTLVGREREWTMLLGVLQQLAAGRGQIVSITGEAGLGKSRLVAELRQQFLTEHGEGARWVVGRCLSYSESVSYQPFLDLIRQLVGLHGADSADEAVHKLRAVLEELLLGNEGTTSLPYLLTFLQLSVDAMLAERVRYLDAEALQRRTFVALSRIIEVLAQRSMAPLTLLLEDIHWIDGASRTLLEHLLPLVNRVPLLILLVYRPERAKTCWHIREKIEREYSYCAVEIDLAPLTTGQSTELLRNLVDHTAWPTDLVDHLLSRTEGNPLYLEEVIRTLIDEGALRQDDTGKWQLDRTLDELRVPDTLQGVIMARLDLLNEPTRWTARVASVVGRRFPFAVIPHLQQAAPAEHREHVVELQQHDIVEEAQRKPELIYAFEHDMLQQVCYESLLVRTRRSFHRKIAEYLEHSRAGNDQGDSTDAVIAHHAFEGQDWPRALHYQLRAGQHAQRLFANDAAIRHFQNALASAEHVHSPAATEQRQVAHAALGEALVTTSHYDQAREHLATARTLAEERGDHLAATRACRWLARLYELRGEYAPAREWIEQGLTAAGGQATAEVAELRLISGLIFRRQGRMDEALEQCQHSIQLAQSLDERSVLARGYALLGVIRLQSNSALAIESFERAFALYEQVGDLHGQAIAHNLIANARFNLGEWPLAEQHYRQARDIFDQIADLYNRSIADNNLAGIALNLGRLNEALALYQSALAVQEQFGGSAYLLGFLHNNISAVFIRRGTSASAREHLERSQAYFEQAQVRDVLPEVHRHLAEAALIEGDLAQAEAHGQIALSLAREIESRCDEGTSLRILGEVATAQGKLDAAATHLNASVAILGEISEDYERARSQLSLARLFLTQTTSAQGKEVLAQATAAFERLQASLDLAAAHALDAEYIGVRG